MLNRTIYRITFVIVSLIIFFLAAIYIIQNGQKEQLQNLSNEGRNRTEILLEKNLGLLSQNQISYTYDYTFWDDMVLFVKNPDPVWAERNIISSINTYKLQCAWVLNSNFKQIFFYSNLPEKNLTQLPIDPEIVNNIFFQKNFPHFFIKTEKYLLEISAAPIHYSDDLKREGIAQGYYITGRIWNDQYLNEIQKINNSEIILSTPEKYSETEKTYSNIDHPEIITAKIPLHDYSGNIVCILISRHIDKGIMGMKDANKQQLPYILVIGVVFLIAIALSLIIWVVIPLNTISSSLKLGETEKIKQLSTHKSEFGSLADLLMKFFRQKDILECEVTIREKTETELLDIKKNLEAIVQERTDNLSKLIKNLENKEKRYRLLVETQIEMICRWLPDTTITFVNKAYCDFFGKDQNELLGSRWIDLVPEEVRDVMMVKYRDIATNVSVIEHELEALSANGNKHWMQWTDIPLRDNAGMVTEFQSIGRDISKRKEAEVNLRNLSSAVVQSPVSIVIADVNGNIEYVNPKFTEVTGYTLEEVIGKNPKILKSGEQNKEFYKDLWDTLLSGKMWEGEFHNKKKNGDLFWENALISPIKNEKGNITHFTAVKEDITEKKKIVNELIAAKESAEQSNKLKDAFIANMSHEIRTPLNGILGMTNLIRELLSSHISKDDEIFFEGIQIASKRIICTIDTILNYSRVQVGEFTTEKKRVNIVQICENLIKEYYYFATSKSLELTFENKFGDAFIFADEYAITQTISNLIDNAIKYTNEGFVKVSLYNSENNELMLDVSDSGIGIENKYLDSIFKPFRQEEIGYKRRYEGVGLGLALVKKLLKLNNSSISAYSIKGKGSTFTVNFSTSVLIPKRSEVSIQSLEKVHQLSKRKDFVILLVEDDTMNQFIIKNYIETKYKILITDTSEDVIDILRHNNVDVILMDISIKGSKNGLELAQEIKMIPEFSNIAIIATTAHVLDQDRQNAIEHKCDDFIPKPFTKKGLLETIDKFVKVESI